METAHRKTMSELLTDTAAVKVRLAEAAEGIRRILDGRDSLQWWLTGPDVTDGERDEIEKATARQTHDIDDQAKKKVFGLLGRTRDFLDTLPLSWEPSQRIRSDIEGLPLFSKTLSYHRNPLNMAAILQGLEYLERRLAELKAELFHKGESKAEENQGLGLRLNAARTSVGHKQADLAGEFNCEVSTISRIEQGKQSPRAARRRQIEKYIENPKLTRP